MTADNLINVKDGDNLAIFQISNTSKFAFLVKVYPSKSAFQFIDYIRSDFQTPLDTNIVNNESILRHEIVSIVTSLENSIGERVKNIAIVIESHKVENNIYKAIIRKGKNLKITKYDLAQMARNTIGKHTKSFTDNYILDVFSSIYTIDKKFTDNNPIGMEGSHVSADIAVLSIPKFELARIVDSFSSYGINVIDCVPAIIGISAVRSLKNKNTMIIQVDANNTTCVCCVEDFPMAIVSIPIGFKSITDALSKKFKISYKEAKEASLLHVDVSIGIEDLDKVNQYASYLPKGEIMDDYIINMSKSKSISHKSLSEITRQKTRLILIKVKEALLNKNIDLKVDTIVITGFKIKGIEELCFDEFKIRTEVDEMSVNLSSEITDLHTMKSAYICNSVVYYLLKKQKRLSRVFKKTLFDFLPSGWTCFLDEIL
ncbi:MAG: hypothetical protein JJW01_03245 [Alphaproteobacteria bacterium]|nr:hypothetical protein [Rickettsiales bacterium]